MRILPIIFVSHRSIAIFTSHFSFPLWRVSLQRRLSLISHFHRHLICIQASEKWETKCRENARAQREVGKGKQWVIMCNVAIQLFPLSSTWDELECVCCSELSARICVRGMRGDDADSGVKLSLMCVLILCFYIIFDLIHGFIITWSSMIPRANFPPWTNSAHPRSHSAPLESFIKAFNPLIFSENLWRDSGGCMSWHPQSRRK